jgi:hypothetical protein
MSANLLIDRIAGYFAGKAGGWPRDNGSPRMITESLEDMLARMPWNGVKVDNVTPLGIMRYQGTPRAVGAANCLAATTLNDGSTNIVITGFTQPTMPTCFSIVGNAAGITGNVVISGTNAIDVTITETLVANGTTTVNGNKAFKTITSVVLPPRNAGGNTISVGYTKKIGFPFTIQVTQQVLVQMLGAANDAATLAVNATTVESNTATLAGTPDGSKYYTAWVGVV